MTSKGNGSQARYCSICGAAYVEPYGDDGEYRCMYCEQTFDEGEIITDAKQAWKLRLDFLAADLPPVYDERPDLTYGVRGSNSL